MNINISDQTIIHTNTLKLIMIEFKSHCHACTHIPPKYGYTTPNVSTGCVKKRDFNLRIIHLIFLVHHRIHPVCIWRYNSNYPVRLKVYFKNYKNCRKNTNIYYSLKGNHNVIKHMAAVVNIYMDSFCSYRTLVHSTHAGRRRESLRI